MFLQSIIIDLAIIFFHSSLRIRYMQTNGLKKEKEGTQRRKKKKKKQTHECRQAPYPLPCPPSPGEEGRWCSQPTDPTPTSCHVSPPCPASWTIGPGRPSFRLPQITPSSVLPHPISYHTPHEENRGVHTRKYMCSWFILVFIEGCKRL